MRPLEGGWLTADTATMGRAHRVAPPPFAATLDAQRAGFARSLAQQAAGTRLISHDPIQWASLGDTL